MEIPRARTQVAMTSESYMAPQDPGASSASARAGAKAGEEVGTSIAHFGRVMGAYQQEENRAKQAVEALKVEHALRTDLDEAAAGLKDRTDYWNFDQHAQDTLEALNKKHSAMLDERGADPLVRRSYEKAFQTHGYEFEKLVRAKKAQVLTEEGEAEWQAAFDGSTREWAYEMDPDRREEIQKQFEMTTDALVIRRAIRPRVAEKGILTFKARAEEYQLRRMEPGDALTELDDPKKYVNLDPLRREELREHFDVKYRQNGTRTDRLAQIKQKANQATAVDMLADGTLDLEKLKGLRARDPETGQPGLSDEFFVQWRDRLMAGKDVITNPDTFNTLFLDTHLTPAKVYAASDRLSPTDQRTLLGHIRQDRAALEAEARYYRRQEEGDVRREARLTKSAEEQRVRDVRGKANGDAKMFIKKVANDAGLTPDEFLPVLKAYNAIYDDPQMKAEDLMTQAELLMKPYTTGTLRKIWNWVTGEPDPDQIEKWKGQTVVGTPSKAGAAPTSREQQEQRAREIFGVKP